MPSQVVLVRGRPASLCLRPHLACGVEGLTDGESRCRIWRLWLFWDARICCADCEPFSTVAPDSSLVEHVSVDADDQYTALYPLRLTAGTRSDGGMKGVLPWPSPSARPHRPPTASLPSPIASPASRARVAIRRRELLLTPIMSKS